MAINTSHPIGSKVRWALRPSESLNEQITGVAAAGTIGTTVELAEGTAYIPATSETTWNTPNAALDHTNNDLTVVWYGRLDINGGYTYIGYFGPYGWEINTQPYDTGYCAVRIITRWGGGGPTIVVPVTDDAVHSIIVRWNKTAANVDLIVDGVTRATDTAWGVDGGLAGATAKFRMRNASASTSACLTAQIYDSYLSDAEISSLASDPMQVFDAGGTDLVVSNASQTNALSGGAIGVVGVIFGDALVQTNSFSSGAIARVQDLTAGNLSQENSVTVGSVNAYTRMRELADAAPLYTWVKVNTTRYVDCQMPLADRPYNYPGQYDHVKIIHPWSSFAYDYDNNRILLWGGGHANYTGNQLYIWNGDTGAWELACLPSAVNGDPATQYIVDKKAPQSSHTYHNNLWLKENNMFVTFGGAATPGGGPILEAYDDEDGKRRVGPWLYDLTKIDSEKVGGSDGSGMDATRLGLNAWQHRRDNVPLGGWNTNAYPIDVGGHGQQASVSISKNGKDYAIMTMDGGTGFPAWYRYEFGDVRNGENDQCIYLGNLGNIHITEGWMVHDTARDLVYRNAYAYNVNTTPCELVVKNPWTTGTSNAQVPIRLVHTGSGTAFEMQKNSSSQETPYAAAYDSNNDCIWLWGGTAPDTGVVYRINIPVYDTTTGWASTTWTVDTIVPQGVRPYGLHITPLLGKLKYVPEVGGLVTLDNPSNDGTRDADVWMFKTTQFASAGLSGEPSTQSNSAGTGSVSIESNLSASGAAQANNASTASVGQEHGVTSAPLTTGNQVTAGQITRELDVAFSPLSQTNTLSAGQVTQGASLPALSWVQGNTLSMGAVEQVQNSVTLSVASPAQTNAVVTGAVSQAHSLSAESITQANSASTGVAAQDGYLAAESPVQSNTLSSGAVASSGYLAASSATQTNALSSGGVVQSGGLVASSAAQGNTMSSGQITQAHSLEIESAAQLNTSSSAEISIYTGFFLADPITQNNLLGAGPVAQGSVFLAGPMAQRNSIGFSIIISDTPIVGDALEVNPGYISYYHARNYTSAYGD